MDSLQGMLVAGQASPAFSLFLCTLLSLLSMLHFLCVLQAQTGLLSSFWYLSCLVQSWLKYLSCHWIMFLRPNQWTLWEGLKQFHLAVLLPFLYLLSGERLPCYFCLVLPYNEDKESDKRVCKGKKVSLEGREQLFFLLSKSTSQSSLDFSWKSLQIKIWLPGFFGREQSNLPHTSLSHRVTSSCIFCCQLNLWLGSHTWTIVRGWIPKQ